MRGITNNLVVIPNNKLGQTIFTNYFLPDRRVGVSITISVAMEEDIDRVEAILRDEVAASQSAIAGLLAEPAPQVLFIGGAADPALIFEVDFSISEFGEQYRVQSELRKRLRKRLRAEGIAAPSAVALALEKIAEGRRAK
jgi:small-conductance mechanosensitive channel